MYGTSVTLRCSFHFSENPSASIRAPVAPGEDGNPGVEGGGGRCLATASGPALSSSRPCSKHNNINIQ